MKKIALMLVAAATLAASVSAPAEARGVRVVRPAAGAPGWYGYPVVRYGW